MMRLFFTWIAVFLFSANFAQTPHERLLPPSEPLSEHAKISLLTCDPGEQLYATFGHSAIRVYDPAQRIDWVFNYGTFSFETPHFYLKFLSGRLMYKLSYEPFKRFMLEYQFEKRRVVEEELNLTLSQKQKIFDFLKHNHLPENRYYPYDFFFDNCATRIIDGFYTAIGDSLEYTQPGNPNHKTFRDLLNEYLTNSYWSKFGINLALGAVVDVPATPLEKTFLPDYLSEYINRCNIGNVPFVKNSRLLVPFTEPITPTPQLLRPNSVFWLLFFVVGLLTVLLRHKSWVIGDRIIYFVFGFLGIVLLLLWFATEHDAMAVNLNVLWANPLYLVYSFYIGRKKKRMLKWGALLFLIMNLAVLLGWNTIPQTYITVIIPLIGILFLRSGILFLRYK